MDKVYVLTGHYPKDSTNFRVLGVFQEEQSALDMFKELLETYIDTKIKEDKYIDAKVREDGYQVTIKQTGYKYLSASVVFEDPTLLVEYEIHERTVL